MTAIVTKKSVTYTQPKLHTIVFNLVLKEGTVEVLNKDFSCQFFEGDSPSQKTTKMIEVIQEEINHYKSAQVIFNSSQLDTAVTAIQGGLVL